MTYTWFFIFNLDDFTALGLVSKSYDLILTGVGQVSVLVTQGVNTSMTYDGVLLPINLYDENPFEFDSHAVYLDAYNNVFLGVQL